jgi:hypothetical protein
LEGPPSHLVSNLTTIEMVQQIIIEAVSKNQTTNIQDRLTPEEIMQGIRTPNEHLIHLIACGRTDAQGMSFADAVRKFLPKTETTIRHDGIYWNGARYRSDELAENAIFRRYAGKRTSSLIQAYFLPACTRYIWVELGGKLMEISSILPHLGKEDQLSMSSFELELVYQHKLKGARSLEDHVDATRVHYDGKSIDLFGKAPSTRVVPGRQNPTEEAQAESKQLRKFFP